MEHHDLSTHGLENNDNISKPVDIAQENHDLSACANQIIFSISILIIIYNMSSWSSIKRK